MHISTATLLYNMERACRGYVDLYVWSECSSLTDVGGLAAGVKAAKESGEGGQLCNPDPLVLSSP